MEQQGFGTDLTSESNAKIDSFTAIDVEKLDEVEAMKAT